MLFSNLRRMKTKRAGLVAALLSAYGSGPTELFTAGYNVGYGDGFRERGGPALFGIALVSLGIGALAGIWIALTWIVP